LSIRGIFQPLLGERIHGFWGHLIDVLATVATLFGVATSLGLGVTQVNGGLSHLFGLPVEPGVQIALIVAITAVATLSVVLGLDKGIKRLSVLNMLLAGRLPKASWPLSCWWAAASRHWRQPPYRRGCPSPSWCC